MKIKKIKYLFSLSLVLVFFMNCSEDDNDLGFVDNVVAPTEVSAIFNITQDNSGLVSITPNSTGAVSYEIGFGDGSNEMATLETGESITHTYEEGTYAVAIKAIGITGLETEASQNLVVSFRAPENLVINTEIDSANPFQVNVSATADYAASFLVYFDTSNPDEVGTPLALEEVVSSIYPLVGDYTIRVEALSGGTEITEGTVDVTISTPTELPIDFEVFDTTVFFGFGGASGAIIDNPDTNGNSSAKVAQVVKGGPEVWAGNVIVASSPIDFSVKKLITLDVWSPRPGGNLLFKLENLDDPGINIEKQVPLIGNSQWEQVTIDFSDIDVSQTYQKLVWFFDFGSVGDGGSDWTFYVDNIDQAVPSTGSFAKLLIEDFEAPAPTLLPFGNASAEVVTLDDGAGNVSQNVAKFVKAAGAETWAGVTLPLAESLDLDTYSNILVKTWSPKIGAVVKVKIENADASITWEVDMNTTTMDAWEELSYDFSGAPAADYVNLVAFFDFGVVGDDSVYYFDDYQLTNNGVPESVIESFESPAPTLLPFGNASADIITLDDGAGNITQNIARFIKAAGAETWAGVTLPLSESLDLDTYSKITVNTWSPKLDAIVKVKIENADASITWEVDMNTTTADAWEELVFDMSGAPAADYVNLVVFFDFGIVGDDSIYYFDDYTLTD